MTLLTGGGGEERSESEIKPAERGLGSLPKGRKNLVKKNGLRLNVVDQKVRGCGALFAKSRKKKNIGEKIDIIPTHAKKNVRPKLSWGLRVGGE